jgi:hypothetical protein
MSMKNSNDTIGNRTRDLPVFSAVPQLNFSARHYIVRPRGGKFKYLTAFAT